LEPIIRVEIMLIKGPRIAVIAVLLSFGGVTAPLAAQSLADVARKEQDRRKTIQKPSKVLTNKDLGGAPGAASPVTPAAAAPDSNAKTPAAADKSGEKPGADGEKKAEEPAKDQAYWSGRAKGLQTQLERDQTFAVALQSRINALTTQYVNQGDPIQQAALGAERQKSVDELNRLTKQVEDDKKAIANLQEDARRAGVPSGWLR
jgi:hypothetical protein